MKYLLECGETGFGNGCIRLGVRLSWLCGSIFWDVMAYVRGCAGMLIIWVTDAGGLEEIVVDVIRCVRRYSERCVGTWQDVLESLEMCARMWWYVS